MTDDRELDPHALFATPAPATDFQHRRSPSAGQRELVASVQREHQNRYAAAAAVVAAGPGRVNLIGEHIDYNDGFVLPMATGQYARRREQCTAALTHLGARSWREVTADQVETNAALSSEQRRYARHVVTEIQRTIAAAAALSAGDWRQHRDDPAVGGGAGHDRRIVPEV